MEQLIEAKYHIGAIMLNGRKYEDWLKDSESHKGDGENDGPS